jgi:CRP-like cAMP-binding protein
VPVEWWPVLRSGELVAYLTEEEYVELLDDALPVSAEPGDVIFFEGAPSKDMVFVIEGELEVIEARDGGEHVVGIVPAGSVAGEVGFFDGSPRSRHVRAKTACELRRLTREALLELLAANPLLFGKVTLALAGLMATRYRSAVERLGHALPDDPEIGGA